LNNIYQTSTPNTNAIPQAPVILPPRRVTERKIGKSTFIVSSRFNDGKEKDIVSTMARLIQYGGDKKDR